MARPVDIVIVTALEEEREAVLRKLPRHRRQNPTGNDIHRRGGRKPPPLGTRRNAALHSGCRYRSLVL